MKLIKGHCYRYIDPITGWDIPGEYIGEDDGRYCFKLCRSIVDDCYVARYDKMPEIICDIHTEIIMGTSDGNK